MEKEKSILISNKYGQEFLTEVYEEIIDDVEVCLDEKTLFHLTKSTSAILASQISHNINLGYKKIFIDDVYLMVFRSENGLQSLLDLEDYYGVEFIMTLQINKFSNDDSINVYEEKVNRFKNIEIIRL